MKKAIAVLVVFVMICCMFTACGQSADENEDGVQQNETENVYEELIGQIHSEIEADTLADSQLAGAYSLYVSLQPLGAEKLTAAGYSIDDINGDGTPELAIGINGDRTILNLYTLSDGEPMLVFEGFARNAYSLMDDGTFCYHGSNSAASSAFGIFRLPAGGTALECEEFWFSEIKPETDMEIGYYYNTEGHWIPEESEELEVSEDEFWTMNGDLMAQAKKLEFTPFAG